MSLFRLTCRDPLVTTLRETFGANLVRVPELRVQPLCVVATRRRRAAFQGDLSPLLSGKLVLPEGFRAQSPMADPQKTRTRNISAKVGLDILEKFLSGFGIAAPGINAHFTNTHEVAFSFQNVVRDWIDINLLGRALRGLAVDLKNPAGRIYIKKDRWRLLVIDSIIKSNGFSITATKANAGVAAINVSAVQQLVGNANASISTTSTSASHITFTGNDHLTFAFSVIEIRLDPSGAITEAPPGTGFTLLSADDELENYVPTVGPTFVELAQKPALIEWDSVDE